MLQPRSLPHSDEAIVANLHAVANRSPEPIAWNGADTKMSAKMIALFEGHAINFWLNHPTVSFGLKAGATVADFVARLREIEKAALAPAQ